MHINDHSNHHIRSCMEAAASAEDLLCDEEYLCSYEFHPDWGEGVQMAKYSSGSGDDIFVIFKGDAAIIKGFDHESPVSPHAQKPYGTYPGIYDGAPEDLLAELRDPALGFDEVTFCLWRTGNSGPWIQGPVEFQVLDDGMGYLLPYVVTSFHEYEGYAIDNFEDEYTDEISEQVERLFQRNTE